MLLGKPLQTFLPQLSKFIGVRIITHPSCHPRGIRLFDAISMGDEPLRFRLEVRALLGCHLYATGDSEPPHCGNRNEHGKQDQKWYEPLSHEHIVTYCRSWSGYNLRAGLQQLMSLCASGTGDEPPTPSRGR